MSDLRFVDKLPGRRPATADGTPLTPVLDELRANPGQWAEFARYPRTRRTTAQQRGNHITKRNDGIEYAVRSNDTESILYLRAASA